VPLPFSVRSRLRLFSTVAFLTIASTRPAAAGTSVTMTFTGPGRRVAPVVQAQLLVTAWGVSERHDLAVEGNVVRLDLQASRPEFVARFADVRGVVYVKATGYPPLLSQAFSWPTPGAPAIIDFRNGRRVIVPEGVDARLHVTLRTPVRRRIRLVDPAGRPIARTKVEMAAYWQAPNHCGFFNGRDVLATAVSNDVGVIDVPDLDGQYAFGLLERYMVFADADSSLPPTGSGLQGLVTSLRQAETTLKVRRYQRRRLVIDILDKGRPLSGAVLWADMALGVCGAGYGKLATADAGGRIIVDAFYPEMWQGFWVCAGREQAWVMPDGSTLPATIDVRVTPGGRQNSFAGLCGK
jgi:hypothetical protein